MAAFVREKEQKSRSHLKMIGKIATLPSCMSIEIIYIYIFIVCGLQHYTYIRSHITFYIQSNIARYTIKKTKNRHEQFNIIEFKIYCGKNKNFHIPLIHYVL